MKNYKLTIDLLPKGAWGNDFSRTLPKTEWDKIRNICYEKAHNHCSICGFETDDLDAHEIWDFNLETKTQTLKNIVAICSKCHGVKHFRNSLRLGFGENAKHHFMKVNNASELDFASHLAKAQILFDERNKIYRWKMVADLEKFGGDNSKIRNIYIPKIINPYREDDLEIAQNDCSFKPRILNIIVDNFQGKIIIFCDRTNKIEFISNSKSEIKFNFARYFKAEFSVKDMYDKNLYFKLSGQGGELTTKAFKLEAWD